MPKVPTFPDCFDECKKITISSLKQLGFLRPFGTMSGPYRWIRNGEPSGSIYLTASLSDREIRLDYRYGEKSINYCVRLVSVPKHFGGMEWYFICPATGKRCKTLYGIGEYFLARSAYPSAMYSSQTESKRYRGFSQILKAAELQQDFLNKRHSRVSYKGKFTKRYKRMLDREARLPSAETVLSYLHRGL